MSSLSHLLFPNGGGARSPRGQKRPSKYRTAPERLARTEFSGNLIADSVRRIMPRLKTEVKTLVRAGKKAGTGLEFFDERYSRSRYKASNFPSFQGRLLIILSLSKNRSHP
ncbi:hypothetical protein JW935_08435 [candidate division KSB1 bacterium]|nr:hypothetical protein [candidate division KSB1 bacterium]